MSERAVSRDDELVDPLSGQDSATTEAAGEPSLFDRAAAALDRVHDKVDRGVNQLGRRSLEGAIARARLMVATTHATVVAKRDVATRELEACERSLAEVAKTAVGEGVELTKTRATARQKLREIDAEIAVIARTTKRLEAQLSHLSTTDPLAVARFLADDDRAYHELVVDAPERELGFVTLLPTLEAMLADNDEGSVATTHATTPDAGLASSQDVVASDDQLDSGLPAGRSRRARTPATDDPRDGKLELERILDAGSAVEVGAASIAVRAASDRLDGNAELPVVEVAFATPTQAFALAVTPADLRAFVPAFASRVTHVTGGEVDPVWAVFATEFAHHFKPILQAFDLGVGASRDVAPERLQFLFTVAQRDALRGFFVTNLIPEQLFDADGSCRATAQQRIVMAAKILADGNYVVGSRIQRVHAQMCFHWAHLVYQYAGVQSEGLNETNVTGSFDFQGNALVTGDVDTTEKSTKKQPVLPATAAHAAKRGDKTAYRHATLPWTELQELETGDWLYTYTGNATSNGEHSVIFAGWADAETHDYQPSEEAPKLRYRRAFTYDQGMPDQGGRRHTILIGEDLFTPDGTTWTRPVTRRYRVDEQAAPADSVAELAGGKHELDAADRKFLQAKEKQLHGTLSLDKLAAWVRDANTELVQQLADDGRLSETQRDMFADATASRDVRVVIAAHQRLLILSRLAPKRDELLATQEDRLDHAKATSPGDERAQLVDLGKMVEYSQQLTDTTTEVEPLEDRLAAIDTRDEIQQLARDRKVMVHERGKLAKADVEGRAAIDDQLHAIDARRAAYTLDHSSNKSEIRELDREIAKLHRTQVNLRGLVDRVQARMLKRDAGEVAAGESLVPIRTKGAISFGTGSVGSLDASGIEVPWASFVDHSAR